MTTSYTRSTTSTYTQSRARYVLGKVYEDILNITLADVISKSEADSWRDSLLYLANNQAINHFEFQFYRSDGTAIGGLRYDLDSSGNIYSDEDSGELDFWGLPEGTYAKLLVDLDYSSSKIEEVNKQLEDWGWGTGESLSGDMQYLKSYSKEGYGLKQNKIGEW